MSVLLAPALDRAPTESTTRPSRDDVRTFVTLSRTSERDCGHRQVVARLDDESKVTLMFGDSVTLEVRPGAHRLFIHNTLFWKHLRFTVETGEHLEFALVNWAGRATLGFLAVLGVGPLFLAVEQRSLR